MINYRTLILLLVLFAGAGQRSLLALTIDFESLPTGPLASNGLELEVVERALITVFNCDARMLSLCCPSRVASAMLTPPKEGCLDRAAVS